ncbi:hypothetical protein [Metabacillus litoralis]|uniref:hypothetical protein n=1 Tax=Metabacillus litoralis TaxID=152268 RepID=UPI001CFD49F0|nr:hypothetical protein [Metabacillus litoralis]
MKKFLVVPLILLLSACTSNPSTLDTSKLTPLEESNVEDIPREYQVASLKDGLDAIPFDLKLPKELPFEAKSFKVMNIMDWNDQEDRKDISIELLTVSEDKKGKSIQIKARDFEVESTLPEPKEVKLKEEIDGLISITQENKMAVIEWEKNGVTYNLLYHLGQENSFTQEEITNELVNLANQML